MEVIAKEKSQKCMNSSNCQTTEYSFKDKKLDLGLAQIQGRYPEKGYCLNLISKELIYVLEGTGELHFKNKTITFKEGDSILINNKEEYFWVTSSCKVAMFCTPAWNPDQYKNIL